MIARSELPQPYREWNRKHHAPFGLWPGWRGSVFGKMPLGASSRLLGPFSTQTNNTFRAFEYPWAYFAARLEPGQRVLEIGGGLSGFQFALSRAGCHVVNVDPGMVAEGNKGWPCDASTMRTLNRAFGSDVELRNCTVGDAQLEPEQYDRAFSISVIEHLSAEEIGEVCSTVYSALKPGGLFVLTIDLFLDSRPFSDRERNEYGKNVDVAWLAGLAPFTIAEGNRSELYGFPEFDPKRILGDLSTYMIGSYPALAQCLVLRK
ncbi:MAG TPA: class I SAM-dependent methyltransferase [Polyangiaceae bacterium]|jgi:SAM-dependent methyltransferase|nr:class I SAM-dependent methyltransferase [Polyangiaceae bacterium]